MYLKLFTLLRIEGEKEFFFLICNKNIFNSTNKKNKRKKTNVSQQRKKRLQHSTEGLNPDVLKMLV